MGNAKKKFNNEQQQQIQKATKANIMTKKGFYCEQQK